MDSEPGKQTTLRVNHLEIDWRSENVVREVSLSITKGQVLALTGEGGSGKSLISQAVAGMLPRDGLKVRGGEIWLDNENLLKISNRKLRQIRQRRIAYFDRQMTEKLNPLLTIKDHFQEILTWKTKNECKAGKNLIQALYEVGIAEPETVLSSLPAELGAEALNRVVICMALQKGVDFIVADEMTANLDTTVERQVLELLVDLKNRQELSMLMVTNHLGFIKALADEVLVMYDGVLIESGTTDDVLVSPKNLYTKELMACEPRLGDGRLRLGEISKTGRQAAIESVENRLT